MLSGWVPLRVLLYMDGDLLKMIFNILGHIEMIRNGLNYIKPANILYHPMPLRIVKTQTRRLNRGYYKLESERKKPHDIGYAVQRKRGVAAEPDIRIVMDRRWEEREITNTILSYISKEDAWAEGGYQPEKYEEVFRKLNPKWRGFSRWAFEFHVIENIISKEEQQKLERSLKHLHQEITEHIHPYVTTKIEKVLK